MTVNMTIGARILAGYGLALLMVGGVGIVAYRATTELVDSADWVTHTHKVKEMLAQVRFTLIDAETGQRGFVITGEERYLDPYTQAIKALGRYVQDLREATVDNPNQQKRLASLDPLIADRLTVLAEVIALRRQRGLAAAAQSMLTDKGKNLTDATLRVIDEMVDEENGLLKQRDGSAKATARFALSATVFGVLLVVILVSPVGVFPRRSST